LPSEDSGNTVFGCVLNSRIESDLPSMLLDH